MDERHIKLCELLQDRNGALNIALSGGIDSLTLMAVAFRVRQYPTIAMHAVSAAVPVEATERCRSLANRFGWPLHEIEAHEFDDPNYVSNPHNRCYYCKNRLFTAIDACTHALDGKTIATGTNTDDLSDYRPGLQAAKEHQIWQPFVEAGIDKKTIRLIAMQEGLHDYSNLPAAPCLSSRVETGIVISTADLALIHNIEKFIAELTSPGDIRCRVRNDGVVVQLPENNVLLAGDELKANAVSRIKQICTNSGKSFIGFETYKMGSAFIKPDTVTLARR